MKFIFENGEVVVCNDEAIAKILRADKRYKEEKAKDEAPKGKGKKAEEVKDEAPKGDESDDKVQE